MIVWNPGIGIFAYIFVVGHQYAFCSRVGGTNFAGFYTGCVTGADGKGGQAGWEGAQGLNHLKRNAGGFMTGVNHQPLQVPRVNQCFQQLGPDAFLAPTEEPAMGGTAVAVARWQVEPGGTGAEYPEHGVAEAAVVLRRPARFAGGRRVAVGPGCSRSGRRCRGDDRRRHWRRATANASLKVCSCIRPAGSAGAPVGGTGRRGHSRLYTTLAAGGHGGLRPMAGIRCVLV